MKRLFLFASVVATLFTACSSEKIEFKDANVKRICLQYWDSDADGELSYDEAAAVTDLSDAFINSEISVFNELKHFTGLTEIGENAFAGCYSLTSITIPESVTEIGEEAFADCSSLTSITIPNSVTSVGYGAFAGCSSLTSVTIPDCVGYEAFWECNSLTDIYINIKDLAAYATGNDRHYLRGNKHLLVGSKEITKLVIPDGVTSIGDHAFSDCRSLTSVTIPDSVTEICNDAFKGCTSLTSVTIPNSVTEIGSRAFAGCSGLKEFKGKFASADNRYLVRDGVLQAFAPKDLTEYTIPDSVTQIGDYAFAGCSGLTSVTIPDSVTEIGQGAFEECTGELIIYSKIVENYRSYHHYSYNDDWLTSARFTMLTIGDNITKIGYYAFAGCNSLTSVTIPASVTEIGHNAFDECASLTDIYINIKDLAAYTTFYDIRYISGNKHLLVDGKEITELVIPDGVTGIGSIAFKGCNSLTSITIPDSVTWIASDAFDDCSSLKEFKGKFASSDNRCLVIDGVLKAFASKDLTEYTIPDGVTQIGDYAFADCRGLTSVTIPDSVTEIGKEAFSSCSSLTSVTIGNGITLIKEKAFSWCSSLTSIYCKATLVPGAYTNMLEFTDLNRKIYVPRNSVDSYKRYWSYYKYDIEGYDF